MTHKLISRLGNKDTDIKFFKVYLPTDDIKYIVEPFGGSFAVSSKFYKGDPKYNYHINDTDPVMYWIYTHRLLFVQIRKLINDMVNNYDVRPYAKQFKIDVREKMDEFGNIPEFLYKYILDLFLIRGCLIKSLKKEISIMDSDLYIIDNAFITNIDYEDILKTYENDDNAFLFLDPPYMFSDNTNYMSQLADMDNTDILYKIYDYMKVCKCKCMLIINDLKLIRHMFGDMVKSDYKKIYALSKKISKHLIITNY